MEINGPVFIGFILAPTIKEILLFLIFHQEEANWKGFLIFKQGRMRLPVLLKLFI